MTEEQTVTGFRVTVLPGNRRFTVGSEETVLHAALRQGVTLSRGCRFGGCGACLVTLKSGRIRYEDDEIPLALGEAAVAPDAIAVCRAIPTSDIIIETPQINAERNVEPGG